MHANLLASSILKQNAQVMWRRKQNPALRNNFKCKDGKWLMSANHPEHKYWTVFCEALGRSDLIADPRFVTREARQKNVVELIELLDEVFIKKTRQEWLPILLGAGLNFAPLQQLDEVINDPQALLNGYLVDHEHPSLGKVRIPGYPVSFGANTVGTHGPAPDIGEHTRSILGTLGYSDQQIEALSLDNVIRVAPNAKGKNP
jgi:crotonobetainyl-CoA:carnitine CoA-transferase CaiB-like acyl-CoA transferase